MKRYYLLLLVFCCSFFCSNAQFVKLLDLNGPVTGANPQGALLLVDSFLYGTTSAQGANNYGTIFKIKPDGTGATNIHDFDSVNGRAPLSALIYDGTYLYGTASGGGTGDNGIIFKIKPNGNSFTNLFSFSGANGSTPSGALYNDGVFLYGLTANAGTANYGTMFKLKPDGSSFSVMNNFMLATGGNPQGAVVAAGSYLYGTTSQGGTGSAGTIFKIKPDGSGYTTVLNFTGSANGSTPYGSLTTDGIYLYGTTGYGGNNNYGVIFRLMPDGSNFSKLYDFNGGYSGTGPSGDVTLVNTTMYVTANAGGANGQGTLVKLKTDGSNFYKLLDFNSAPTGRNPIGSLISDGNFVYGTAYLGGATNEGTVFKYPICTQLLSTIEADTICAGQAITIGGHTYSATGTYYDTTVSAQGCLTAATRMVQVQNIDLTLDIRFDTLKSNEANATYQWIDCATNTQIPGATNQQYVAGQAGYYAVIITKGCTDTTSCFSATPAVAGVNQLNTILGQQVSVFPNPASSVINIICHLPNAQVDVYDMLGQQVYSAQLQASNKVNTSAWQAGLYTVVITSGDKRLYKKVAISH